MEWHNPMENKSKKPRKNRIETGLNTLILIIALLSFGLVGSLLYESDITANNQITGKVSGMEGVKGA